MPKTKRRRRMPTRNATVADQGAALGHLLYEMLILASALVFRNKRHLFSFFEGLEWGIPQSGLDVIRLKSRLLIDFFELRPRGPHPNEMLVSHFTSVPADAHPTDAAITRSAGKVDSINEGVAHLSWGRLTRPLPTPQDRKELDEAALALMGRAVRFVERGLANGLRLDKVAQTRRQNVNRLYALLRSTPLIDERTVRRPPPNKRINLETLT